MTDPHTPRVDGDRLYGRGAYDMKAGVASALLACREAAALGLAGDVVVAAVADEEHASIGVQEALAATSADAAIVTEPTELELIVAHKGFVWVEIEVTGVAAHGSRPHLGVDAIVKSGPVLTALGALDEALGERTHPLLGRGSVHASTDRGRSRAVQLPGALHRSASSGARCPARPRAGVEAEIGALLDTCRAAAPDLVAEQRTLLVREPFEVGVDAEHRRRCRCGGGRRRSARRRPLGGASYWADAAFIAAAGHPDGHVRPVGGGRARRRGVGQPPGHGRRDRDSLGVASAICA